MPWKDPDCRLRPPISRASLSSMPSHFTCSAVVDAVVKIDRGCSKIIFSSATACMSNSHFHRHRQLTVMDGTANAPHNEATDGSAESGSLSPKGLCLASSRNLQRSFQPCIPASRDWPNAPIMARFVLLLLWLVHTLMSTAQTGARCMPLSRILPPECSVVGHLMHADGSTIT